MTAANERAVFLSRGVLSANREEEAEQHGRQHISCWGSCAGQSECWNLVTGSCTRQSGAGSKSGGGAAVGSVDGIVGLLMGLWIVSPQISKSCCTATTLVIVTSRDLNAGSPLVSAMVTPWLCILIGGECGTGVWEVVCVCVWNCPYFLNPNQLNRSKVSHTRVFLPKVQI